MIESSVHHHRIMLNCRWTIIELSLNYHPIIEVSLNYHSTILNYRWTIIELSLNEHPIIIGMSLRYHRMIIDDMSLRNLVDPFSDWPRALRTTSKSWGAGASALKPRWLTDLGAFGRGACKLSVPKYSVSCNICIYAYIYVHMYT